MKYFKLSLTQNVTTDASLSGLSHGHVVYSGFAKNTTALTDWEQKKKTISAGVKVSKSRKCISCLHRRSWNSCESVTKTHFHLHFPANYLLVGRCEPGSWTGDSVPGLPRWDKTQGVTPSWSQHELEVVLSCLDRNVTFTRLKFCQLNAIHGESSEGGGSVRQVLWREREG